MYDYKKMDISYLDFDKLRANQLLNWSMLIDVKSGEILPMLIDRYKSRKTRPDEVAVYKSLYFERFNIRNKKGDLIKSETYLSGSLPKYHNNGDNNATEYTLQAHIKVIRELESLFGIIPSKTRIHHIEVSTLLFGLEYRTKDIIDNLMFHSVRGGGPKEYNRLEIGERSLFKVAKRGQYSLKAYCKGLQFDLGQDAFRFEIKFSRMEPLNNLGFMYLSQTTEPKYVILLQMELVKRWEESILFDWTINTDSISKTQINNLKEFRNTRYWIELSPVKRCKKLKEYKEIVSRFSANVHQYIGVKMKENINNLTASVLPMDINKLTNSIVSPYANSDRKYPEFVYVMQPQEYARKKLRNDVSNFIRSYAKKVKKLIALDKPELIVKIPLTDQEKRYLVQFSEYTNWKWLFSIVRKYSII